MRERCAKKVVIMLADNDGFNLELLIAIRFAWRARWALVVFVAHVFLFQVTYHLSACPTALHVTIRGCRRYDWCRDGCIRFIERPRVNVYPFEYQLQERLLIEVCELHLAARHVRRLERTEAR